MVSIPQLDVIVFAGQGTAAANTFQTREQALRDATSSSGALLLSSCLAAFHSETSSLLPDELRYSNIDLSDFKTPQSLLVNPPEQYAHNAVISGTTLFLIQSLRYLAFVEASAATTTSLTPFSDVLKLNAEHGLGVLGFSSGILPACVVGTSFSTVSFISHAVEAYRLAFWIGVRAQKYRMSFLDVNSEIDPSLPWSLVFLGLSKDDAEEAISAFQSKNADAQLDITAVMDDTCVTISSRPDTLAAFSATLPGGVAVHKTTLDSLYHSPLHANGIREQVLADVTNRNIKFPTFADVKVPIRSTFTGDNLQPGAGSASLVEATVDLLLTQPVNWNLVVKAVVQASPSDASVRLVNVGPGAGLTRTMERNFPREHITSLDLTTVEAKAAKRALPKQEPVAIVGMAVNMPGAPNTSKLWEVLEQGINTISEIPEHRFRVADYNDSQDSKSNRSMKAHTGNFIGDPDAFDNKFFRISPREAKSMDPQQRVLLHTAYEALENSGYVPNATPSFQQDTFGCYVGVATGDYVQNLRDEIDVYYSTGTLRAFLSGRISYAMQLSGPSIVIDTACSSSIVAIYQACRALMNKDCNAALAGGVNVIAGPDMFLGLDRGHFLSPTGQCKAFDASADGYSRSEGCGVFVLKRLSDAVAENDNILGVIRGIEVNQSGLAHSITHPHAPTQATLFKQVLEKTGVDASRVNVVEAHGTGTQAGDPNELESIRGVFAARRTPGNPLHITSVKANIGHLEAASGTAGLAKLLLMLRHRTIPRLISLKNLNPKIAPLSSDHTVIDTIHTPWIPSHEGQSRMALLNNFGAAGSNGALLLEEFVKSGVSQPLISPLIFGLSAKTESALDELRSRYIQWLKTPDSDAVRFTDMAYTATARRQLYSHRLAISASNKTELVEKLHNASAVHATDPSGKVVFVFSGQGGQYLGMGSSLYKTSPLFKQHVDECHNILVAAGFPGVLQIITSEGESSGLEALEEFEAYQAAIFTLEYALSKVWLSWGLSPTAVVGHSLGEYAALVTAGVLTLKGALTIIANRVRFMVQKCAVDTTGMIAVNLCAPALSDVLASSDDFSALSIACYNSASDCVVAGPLEKLRALKSHLDAEVHCKNMLLSVPFGYHSSAMHPLLDDLTLVAKHVTIRAPTIPVISNVLGDVVLPGDSSVFNAEYFSLHCAQPVQFDSGINAFTSLPEFAKVDAWVEIGPHTTTLPMLKSNASLSKDPLLLGSLRKQQDAWATLTNSLTQLYLSSITVAWREVFAHVPSVSCIDLPSYPFSTTKFWVDWKEPIQGEAVVPRTILSPATSTEYSMLGSWSQFPSEQNERIAIFETPISDLAPSIRGHSVGGLPLCPASVYIEQVYAGLDLAKRHLGLEIKDSQVVLRGLVFAKPLVYDEHVARVVKTTITLDTDGSGTFSVSSRVGSEEESVHVSGEFRYRPTSQISSKFSHALPIVNRQMAAVIKPREGELAETFSTRTAYEVIFPRVVDYSKEYHTMQSLTVDPSGMEGYALVKLPSDYSRAKFVVHPVFMDTLLHVAGFVANMQGGVNDAFICTQVGTTKVITELIDNNASYLVYCNNAWLPDEGVMLAEAYAVQAANPKKIVAHLKGMHFRRVRLNSLKRSLTNAAGHAPSQISRSMEAPKVARIAVAPPTVFQPSQEVKAAFVDVQAEVVKIVSETCDISADSIDVRTDLSSLGVDSLMSIEIFGKLQAAFPHVELNSQALTFCNTVAEIVTEISPKLAQGVSSVSSPRTLVPEERLSEPTALNIDEELDVKPVLASVLGVGVHEISDDADFDDLGLDSLTSIEALHALKSEFGLELPSDFFTTYATAKAVQAYFADRLKSSATLAGTSAKVAEVMQSNISSIASALKLDTIPVHIQKSTSSHPPLILIHDGSGLVNYYDRLRPLDRNIWGIHNPNFTTGKAWDSVVSMATVYADYVTKTTSGPVLLGGWSFGGVAAFEAGRQLLKKGFPVKGVVLIDSPSPVNHVPLSDSLLDSVINLDARSAGSEIGKLVKAQFETNSRLLGKYDPIAGGGPYPPLVLLRSRDGFKPEGVSGVPSWLSDRSDVNRASTGWESLVGKPVKVIDIPGHHFQPFQATNVAEVSSRIADGCIYLESL